MAQIETWLDCDLDKLVEVKKLPGNFFTTDNNANKIGVRVKKGGQDVTLSGGCTGYVIRQDGYTVSLTGTVSGNTAYIVLTTSCYVVPGQISIVIKNDTTTIGACCGVITRTTTDAIVDPGHLIPSLEELLAQIAACEEATTAATSAATSANTAATNANTATTNANTAAGEINNMTADAESVSASTSASVTVSEVSGHKHLHFALPKGVDGRDGVIAQVDAGLFLVNINSDGDLICTYSTTAPALAIDANGDLIYTI